MNKLITDYFAPTSQLIKERLELYNITQRELATRLGMSEKNISELLNNKISLTIDVARGLEKVINLDYKVLMQYEIKYRGFIEEKREIEQLKKENLSDICKRFQISFMKKKKWLDLPTRASKLEKVRALLNFFGVKDMKGVRGLYGKKVHEYSFKEDGYQIEPLLVWIRKCEVEARKQRVQKYNKEKFKIAINEIRSLLKSNDISIFDDIKNICNRNGVYFVMEEAVPNSKVRGAFTWIGENPAIQISLRYRSNDHFWFAFFHEIGHLMLHAKRSRNFFIDYNEEGKNKQMEKEADDYAKNLILNNEVYDDFVNKNNFSEENIIRFAEDNKVHPGIVVGRLQHDGKLAWNKLSKLKRNY